MVYILNLFFNSEKEKEDFKKGIVKPIEVKDVKEKSKYTSKELNKMLKRDLIKMILNK